MSINQIDGSKGKVMKRHDRISSLTLLFLAICICIGSSRYPLGSWHDPGPGFLPLITGILLGGLSIILFIQVQKGDLQRPKESAYPRHKYKNSIIILGALFGYAVTLEILGFLLCTFLLLVLLFRGVIETQKWLLTIGESAVVSFSAYVLFDLCLKAQLPKGILGF
jgi:putative tricarboxylic transport membrane protein